MTQRRLFARCLPFVPLIAVAACAHKPLDYIPASDRSMLEAQARLGIGGYAGGKQGPITVQQLLSRAKGGAHGAASGFSGGMKLRFADGQVQPDGSQRDELTRAAAQAGRQPFTVIGSKGLLGERRAVAVANVLSGSEPDVVVRFEPDVQPDQVLVVAGAVSDGGAR